MPNRIEIMAGVAETIRELPDAPPDLEDMGPDTPLFRNGLELDSFSIVELISRLEGQFAFEFREADFREAHFRTVGTLVSLVDRYVNG